MGAGTKVGQGKRRARVATFHAIGMESDAISEIMGVSLRTVQDDIKNIREGKFFEKLPQELRAEIDGVASSVLAPVVDLLDHEEPGVRIAAARAIWAIYKDKVLLQQTLGIVAKAPQKVESTSMSIVFKKLTARLSMDAVGEVGRALNALWDEDPEAAALLDQG